MNQNFEYNGRYTPSTRDRKSGGMLGSPLPFALALICGGGLIFGFWYYFYAGTHSDPNQPLPVIKAEAGPLKVKPDSAAQPEVPHQDKLVYSRVNPAEQGKGIERLLPPTEEPVDIVESEKAAAPVGDSGFPNPNLKGDEKSQFRAEPLDAAPVAQTAPSGSVAKAEVVHASEKEDVEVAPLPGALIPEKSASRDETPLNAEVAKSAQKQTAAEVSVSVPKSAGAKVLQTGYRVQLASMKSQELAKGEWKRLQNEYKGVLGGLSPTYSRVDLGAKKGIYYRVQAGDFASKTDAQNACTKLKAQNPSAGCIIVKF